MKRLAQIFLAVGGVASVIAFLFFRPEPNLNLVLLAPSLAHWLGCDSLGRDLLLQILCGNFLSWTVGLLAAFLSLTFGGLIGALAGWFGRGIDFFVMRLMEIWSSVPELIMVTLFVLLLKAWAESWIAFRLVILSLGIALTHWVHFARLTRSLLLQESKALYVEGAISIGVGPFGLLWRHMRPHVTPVLLQSMAVQLPAFLLFESLISFLGFGLQPPEVSLGTLLNEGWKAFSVAPHLLLAPGLVLFATLGLFQIAVTPSSRKNFIEFS